MAGGFLFLTIIVPNPIGPNLVFLRLLSAAYVVVLPLQIVQIDSKMPGAARPLPSCSLRTIMCFGTFAFRREYAQWPPPSSEAPSKHKLYLHTSFVVYEVVAKNSKRANEIMRLSVDLDPETLDNVRSQKLSSNSSNVQARNNRDRIFLPLAIPIQRNWHCASPCADQRAQCHAVYLVQGQLQACSLHPDLDVKTVHVEQLWSCEEAKV